MKDRTVHAHCDCQEVVRYDRAGKWWIEMRDGTRYPVSLSEAVSEAAGCEMCDGAIFYGRRGGTAFDRNVRKALGDRPGERRAFHGA